MSRDEGPPARGVQTTDIAIAAIIRACYWVSPLDHDRGIARTFQTAVCGK